MHSSKLAYLKFGLALTCMSVSASTAAVELLDPGWGDPFFRGYLEQRSARSATSSGIDFSLPVLGFSQVGPPGNVTERTAPVRSKFSQLMATWPACANDTPEVTTVPTGQEQSAGLPSGSWYTSTYDFGCVEIVVEGDQNTPDASLVRDRDAPRESGDIQIVRQDENAGTTVDEEGRSMPLGGSSKLAGPVVISYTRGNLTYGVTISCSTPQSEALCENNGDLRALVNQLVPIAGQPDPEKRGMQ